MTNLDSRSLSLYRTYLRSIRGLVGQDESKLINLRRSFNTQWRNELLQATGSMNLQEALDQVERKMSRTLSLLSSSRRLTSNLSSLSYHHHPHHIPSTSNSSRLYSHTPKPIEWDPQDPGKALKVFQKRKKDREERGEGKLGELVDFGLKGLRNRAEKEIGVALGRWDLKR
ncbi:hypothetical protein JCM5350_007115 [Sporobolomyces pararoseus]